MRPLNGVMAAVGVALGAALAGVMFTPLPNELIMAAISVFLISGAGMTLNDYFDFEMDKRSKPDRPIPSGRISARGALNFSIILYAVAAAIILFTYNQNLILLAAANILVTAAYAWKLKRTAIGHFAVSWLVASTFLFGALLINIIEVVWLVFGLSFIVNMAREMAKGIEDYKTDKAAGAKTLTVVLGMDAAELVFVVFLFLGILSSFLPFLIGGLGLWYMSGAVLADAMLIWSGWLLFRHPAKSQTWIKAAMVVVLAAIAAGILV